MPVSSTVSKPAELYKLLGPHLSDVRTVQFPRSFMPDMLRQALPPEAARRIFLRPVDKISPVWPRHSTLVPRWRAVRTERNLLIVLRSVKVEGDDACEHCGKIDKGDLELEC